MVSNSFSGQNVIAGAWSKTFCWVLPSSKKLELLKPGDLLICSSVCLSSIENTAVLNFSYATEASSSLLRRLK